MGRGGGNGFIAHGKTLAEVTQDWICTVRTLSPPGVMIPDEKGVHRPVTSSRCSRRDRMQIQIQWEAPSARGYPTILIKNRQAKGRRGLVGPRPCYAASALTKARDRSYVCRYV